MPQHYTEHFRLYDPIGGEHKNIMKAGLLTAHRLIAVSHGCGLGAEDLGVRAGAQTSTPPRPAM